MVNRSTKVSAKYLAVISVPGLKQSGTHVKLNSAFWLDDAVWKLNYCPTVGVSASVVTRAWLMPCHARFWKLFLLLFGLISRFTSFMAFTSFVKWSTPVDRRSTVSMWSWTTLVGWRLSLVMSFTKVRPMVGPYIPS